MSKLCAVTSPPAARHWSGCSVCPSDRRGPNPATPGSPRPQTGRGSGREHRRPSTNAPPCGPIWKLRTLGELSKRPQPPAPSSPTLPSHAAGRHRHDLGHLLSLHPSIRPVAATGLQWHRAGHGSLIEGSAANAARLPGPLNPCPRVSELACCGSWHPPQPTPPGVKTPQGQGRPGTTGAGLPRFLRSDEQAALGGPHCQPKQVVARAIRIADVEVDDPVSWYISRCWQRTAKGKTASTTRTAHVTEQRVAAWQ